MNRFHLRHVVAPDDPGTLADLLAARSGLSKTRIRDAMTKGAVWLKGKGRRKRVRRASACVKPGNIAELFYDPALLARRPPRADCVEDLKHYSVWNKPPGLLSQGTEYGDHCSVLRQAECSFRPRRPVFLVHRLDREASGLMLIAHSRKGAGALSRLFQRRAVRKIYRVEVFGRLPDEAEKGRIDIPLDGKPSVTRYEMTAFDPTTGVAKADVIIETGRKHQSRRHFEGIGHPVMGDPLYGQGNKNDDGLKLAAVELSFICPFLKKAVAFRIKTSI